MTDVTKIIALKQQVDLKKELIKEENLKLNGLINQLKILCDHPATTTITDSMDDEYGKYWYSTRHKKCVFCGTVFDNEISYGYDGKWEKHQ